MNVRSKILASAKKQVALSRKSLLCDEGCGKSRDGQEKNSKAIVGELAMEKAVGGVLAVVETSEDIPIPKRVDLTFVDTAVSEDGRRD